MPPILAMKPIRDRKRVGPALRTNFSGSPFAFVAASVLVLVASVPLHAQTDTLAGELPEDTLVLRGKEQQLPVYTITADDLDNELGAQDISGILQSSRDVFAATAGFNFGQARFRIRGYDGRHTPVSINGVLVNDLESGWASWTQWAGLNDVTRWMRIRTGTAASRYNFGGIGGYTDISVRAGDLRRGVRSSYAASNRAYRNRVMVTASTGMMKNGWAFSFSGSRRWAEEGFVEGTPFDAYAYFLGAEKRINARHSISLSAFGAPITQGRQGLAIQEAFDLAGTNYYNPNWGLQNGVKRNARMTTRHRPMFMLTHNATPDERTTWSTSLFYTFGREGFTNLNWFDARDPRPDYWRYLPSFYRNVAPDPGRADALENAWRTDVNTRQIDWDGLFFANRKNLFSVQNANGIVGNTVTGNRSKYIVEEQRADPNRIGINSVMTRRLDDGIHLTVGGSLHKQATHYYRLVNDLLGGDYWLDLDQFANRDFNDTTLAQNDLTTPNRTVGVGDVFGHDYRIHTRYGNVFAQYERDLGQWETYAGLSLSYTDFWREGNMVNGRFPENSFGDSDKQQFLHYGLKAGAVYKITGRHFVSANMAYIVQPPGARAAYLSPRTRDAVTPGLMNERIFSGDLNYVVRMPRLKGRATVYYTRMADQIWARNFYHDQFRTIVNYSMRGVDQVHMGTELGLEASLTSTWTMTAVFAGGSFLYDSRPKATITRDNSDEPFAVDRVVYWKNYRVGGMPQTAASLGLRYNSPQYWFVGFNANYFDHIYLDPNPDRRTADALGSFVTDDPQWDKLLAQTRLDANYTLDVYAGRSWLVKGYRIAVNATVSNLLDNQDFIIGGFEQLRYDRNEVDRFPPRFSYLFGRTFFAMLTFSF